MSTPPAAGAAEIARQVAAREVSPVELVDAVLADIDTRGDRTNAFVTVLHDSARTDAREAERLAADGRPLGPLHGVPIAIKDLYADKSGVRATAGSRVFADHVATTTTAYVQRLEHAGAIIVGTTNTPEFGYKGTTDNALIGASNNPHNLQMNAGGSSGGSAAAVADGLVPLAQGTDGGGSIRIPASMCGLVGMKATFGLVPMVARPDGFNLHTPYAHAGPLARTVEDAALMLDAMIGPHPRDPHSVPAFGPPLAPAHDGNLNGLRIGYSSTLGGFPVEPEVTDLVQTCLPRLQAAGAEIVPVEIDWPASPHELAMLWRRQSAVRNLEAVESYRRAGTDLLHGPHAALLTDGFREVLELGRRQSLLDYRLDDVTRTRCYDAIQDVFDHCDLLVSPVLSIAGVPNDPGGDTLGPNTVNGERVDPVIGWCLTFPFNFTGHPAASAPAGYTTAGLPVGLQIVGRRFEDRHVLRTARALELH